MSLLERFHGLDRKNKVKFYLIIDRWRRWSSCLIYVLSEIYHQQVFFFFFGCVQLLVAMQIHFCVIDVVFCCTTLPLRGVVWFCYFFFNGQKQRWFLAVFSDYLLSCISTHALFVGLFSVSWRCINLFVIVVSLICQ